MKVFLCLISSARVYTRITWLNQLIFEKYCLVNPLHGAILVQGIVLFLIIYGNLCNRCSCCNLNFECLTGAGLLMIFIISSIVIFGLGILSDHYLRKKFGIENRKGFSFKSVNKLQRWVERGFIVIFLIALWFLIDYALLLCVSYFVVMNLFRSLMEWRYEREKKEYILTLHSIMMYLLFVGSYSYFL